MQWMDLAYIAGGLAAGWFARQYTLHPAALALGKVIGEASGKKALAEAADALKAATDKPSA